MPNFNMLNVPQAVEAGQKMHANRMARQDDQIVRDDKVEAKALGNKLSVLKQTAVGGGSEGEEALKNLIALDPEMANQFMGAIGTMDEQQAMKATEANEQMGNFAYTAMSAENPEAFYMAEIAKLPPELQKNLPVNYDPQELQAVLNKATSIATLLENPKAIQVGGEDRLYKGGREIDRVKRPVKPAAGGTGAGGGRLKPTDESRIYNDMIKTMSGIDMDSEDGAAKFAAFSQVARDNIVAVVERAVELINTNPNMSVTAAKAQARKEAGGESNIYKKKNTLVSTEEEPIENVLGRYIK